MELDGIGWDWMPDRKMEARGRRDASLASSQVNLGSERPAIATPHIIITTTQLKFTINGRTTNFACFR